jgi:hypothetical protein
MSVARKKRESGSKEKRLAAYFQTHKGDTSIWESRSTPAEKPKEPAVVFSVRLTPDELEGIRKEAEGRGIPVSVIVRSAIVERHLQAGGVYSFGGPMMTGRVVTVVSGNVINTTEYCGRSISCNGWGVGEFGGSWDANEYSRALGCPPVLASTSNPKGDPKRHFIGPLQIPVP